jgi:hypothetical protein
MSTQQDALCCEVPVEISGLENACRQLIYRRLVAEFDLLWSQPHSVLHQQRMDYVISVIEALEKSDTNLGKASLSWSSSAAGSLTCSRANWS